MERLKRTIWELIGIGVVAAVPWIAFWIYAAEVGHPIF